MNKKIVLIIILVAILMLGAVWLINESKNSPMPIEEPKQEKVTEEISTVEPEKTEVKEEKEVSVKTQKARPVKKFARKPEASKPNQVEVKSEAVQLESTVVTEEVQEEKDVVVPVKYTSKNIYKYVYTPAGFKK